MSVTLLALYRRPDGGEEALDSFMSRYQAEHMPLIERVPGLRGSVVQRVAQGYAGDDIVLVTHMSFDDRDALDIAMASDEMRQAGRVLRDIAPGLLTLVALEEESA